VRAKEVAVEMGAGAPEKLIHSLLHRTIVVFAQEPTRNSGLVGYNQGDEPMVIEPANGAIRARKQANLPWIPDVAGIFDNGAIPIQEGGRSSLRASIARHWRAHEE
jgi:hypothetical protein